MSESTQTVSKISESSDPRNQLWLTTAQQDILKICSKCQLSHPGLLHKLIHQGSK